MDKSKNKEDDQVFIEKVGRDDVSDDIEDGEGFLSILWSDNRLTIFKGIHLDRFVHKETLQAEDTIRYIRFNGVAGRKGDLEITEIVSVHPEKEYPLVLANNEKLTATTEN
eukprot:7568187-Ditylum_brightwellii.AAC.1